MLLNQKTDTLQTPLMDNNTGENNKGNYNDNDYDDYSDNNQVNDKVTSCSSTWWWVSLVLIGLLMVALGAATYLLWSCKRSTATMESVMVVDPGTAYFDDFREKLNAQLRGDL